MKYVILKNTVGSKDEMQAILEAHRHFLETLRYRNILLMAGTFEDRSGGMLVVETESLEQAIAIARNDPLVKAGIDRYLVRGWRPSYDGSGPMDTAEQMALPLRHVDSGPIRVDNGGESFQVVDASEHPEGDTLLLQCFAPNQIAPNDPIRRSYLRRARKAGLRKLLLVHPPDDSVAGQVELAPPGVSGLPVQGDEVSVISCLWVRDAYTGLSGGRQLLAAAAEASGAGSLATIAYNATLPWLNRTFFERQGFAVIDQMETGRFVGNTPIVAHLLWRPLRDGAPQPSWDKEQLVEGITFCPGYPWLFGKRRYWGRDFSYHGTVVREGLRRIEVLAQFPLLGCKRVGNWTLIKIGFPEADLPRVIEVLQAALMDEPPYFANLYGGHDDRLIIVYPDRVFRMSADPATWKTAIRHGTERGIPQEELVFGAANFDEAVAT